MKKLITAGFIGVLACSLVSNAVNAQSGVAYASNADDGINSLFNASNFINSSAAHKGGTSVSAANIGTKVQKTFSQRFGERSNVRWTELTKKNFLAEFDLNGRKTNALFANNGFMVYAVSYGVEKDMPKDVRRTIRSQYSDYDIGSTFEIKFKGQSFDNAWADQTAWVVNLEDENNIIIARVIDGSVDELANLQKKPTERVRKGKIIIPRQ